MWQQISKNKKNTIFIIFAMGIFFLVFGAALGYYIGQNGFFAIFGMISTSLAYIIMLSLDKKKLANYTLGDDIYAFDKTYDPKLYNVVEEMAIAAGLERVPDVYILDTDTPNAFACGVNQKNSSIYITKGLLELLDRDELQGVVAHEIAHIVNRDITYLLYAGIMVVVIFTCTRFFTRICTKSSSKAPPFLMIGAILVIIFAPLISYLFYFSLSRKREYLADACAVQFTRYPQGLARALKKISVAMIGKRKSNKFSWLFFMDKNAINIPNKTEEEYYDELFDEEFDEESIIDEAKEAKNNNKNTSSNLITANNPFLCASCIIPLDCSKEGSGLFSTHPSTNERIKILLKMTGADYLSYNNAFNKITGQQGVIKDTDVKSCKKTPIVKPEMIAGVALAIDSTKKPDKKQKFDKVVEKRRDAKDLVRKLADYSFIACDCSTTLKIPACYQGQEIICPHCKKKHVVEKSKNENK